MTNEHIENYVDSMTPEERKEQDKLQESVVVTTASATPDTVEKVLKEFDEKFYEGERNSIFCKEHNIFATPHELKQFISSLIDSTRKETLEEVERWAKKNECCSKCCSPKEFCSEWGKSASALDTADLLSKLEQMKK